MDEQLESLREQYYQAIDCLQDKKEILEALPQPDYVNFLDITEHLIDRFEKNIEETTKMIHEETDFETREYLEHELELYKFKQEVCQERYDKVNEENNLEIKSEEEDDKSLIFAASKMNGICVEDDIKGMSEEYYERIQLCLERIKGKYKEDNTVEARKLINNKKMENVYEMKAFKVRVLYKHLTPDTTYVMGVYIKKSQNDLDYRDFIVNRNKNTKKEYGCLKKKIEDENMKMQIVGENNQIARRVFDRLQAGKRGVKHE